MCVPLAFTSTSTNSACSFPFSSPHRPLPSSISTSLLSAYGTPNCFFFCSLCVKTGPTRRNMALFLEHAGLFMVQTRDQSCFNTRPSALCYLQYYSRVVWNKEEASGCEPGLGSGYESKLLIVPCR